MCYLEIISNFAIIKVTWGALKTPDAQLLMSHLRASKSESLGVGFKHQYFKNIPYDPNVRPGLRHSVLNQGIPVFTVYANDPEACLNADSD